MGLMHAILLGCLQGVTEFLPVSSSAHLVAAQALLGAEEPGIYLEVSVHFGTLLAILVVFGRELVRVARDGVRGTWLWLHGAGAEELRRYAPRLRTAVAVVVGTLPAAFAGVLLGERVEAAFESVPTAGAFLMVTGFILLGSRLARPGRTEEPGAVRGLLVGIAQALALLPGISRSGSTIVAGRLLGMERAAAARFSFVLAVPALIG
ncbi:MAG: undecaprenyl-diphosphate phosphatase, partial [Candidatus Brocadiia bacterium]